MCFSSEIWCAQRPANTLQHDMQWSLQLQIDWYKQHGLESIEMRLSERLNQPVKHLPASLTHHVFGYCLNRPVNQLPAFVTLHKLGQHFNQSVEQLPPSITHATFGREFNQPVNLPESANLPTSVGLAVQIQQNKSASTIVECPDH